MATRTKALQLVGTASVAAGAAVAVPKFAADFSVDIIVPGTATVQLQGSLNGTDWYNIGSAATNANARIRVQDPVMSLRLNTTSYSSGGAATAVAVAQEGFKDVRNIEVKASVAAGAATVIEDMTGCVAQVGGTFGGDTVQVQTSLDGTNWVQQGSDFTSAGTVSIPDGFVFVRANTTVHSTGAVTVAVAGATSVAGANGLPEQPAVRPLRKNCPVALFSANPAAPTVTPTGTTGATNYSYKVVGVNAQGQTTAASSAGSTSTGNATLNGTNYNAVTWTSVAGAVSYNVYRTVGGATQGLIASGVTSPLNDTGLTADGTTAPASNSTGIGTGVVVDEMLSAAVIITGTFVGTIQMQGSNDGTNWINIGSAQTAATATPVAMFVPGTSPEVAQLRAKMTAYTSGTPLVAAYGPPA